MGSTTLAWLTPTERTWARWLSNGSFALAGLYVFAIVARYGFVRIFSMWAAYDDEGYVMQSVRSYLDGHTMYDEVFSQYGPAYFLLQDLVYGAFAIPLTHDTVRLMTLAVWLVTAVAAAAIVWRLTGRLALALISFLHVFLHLTPLISEPGHPQAILGLSFTLSCLVLAGERGKISRRHAAACGVLAGFAALAKINVGAYLFLGVAIPLACATPLGRLAGPVVLFLSVAVPLAVFKEHLTDRSAHYAIVGAVSTAATAWTCHRLYRPPTLERGVLRMLVAAFSVTMLCVLSVILARGTSLTALVDSVLVQPARLADLFYMPVAVSSTAALVSVLALALAVILTGPVMTASRRRLAVLFAAKTAFACGSLYASRVGYLALIEYVTPFLWIVVLPGTGTESQRALVARGVLAATAAFQCLQGYPVGGSQITFATALMIPVAFVSLHDAMRILELHVLRHRVAHIGLAAAAIVWALSFYRPIIGPEVRLYYEAGYQARHELRLPGTSRIRLLPHEVELLHWMSGTLKAECTAFVSVPGFNSLYPWTGLAPLTTKNAGTWMSLLPADDQDRIWRGLDAAASPCAIFNGAIANNWLDRPIETFTSYDRLMARFQSVAEVRGFHFMAPRATATSHHWLMTLAAGRQTFEPARAYLPVVSKFLIGPLQSTIRTWIRTTRSGAVLGCQTGSPDAGRPARGGLLLYVGANGTLYGQYSTGGFDPESSHRAVNDGQWHHVAMVRDGDRQALYVDGLLNDTLEGAPVSRVNDEHGDGMQCQAGIGFTASWPHARLGWMGYRGEMEGLAVASRAWTADDVLADYRKTMPNE